MRALLFSVLVLTGCSTQPTSVQVPISAPCKVQTPNQPTFRYSPPYENVFDGVRDLLGDREVTLGYEEELRAALKACQ